uniref:Dockerin domain-containing protein n=1 Tax=uncultured Methanosarcinales archaeon TaxID=183757 RepID=A0A7H1KNE8_9EURY|nr:hypothetical protein EKMJPAOO_00012 [uncultured Methanosarcinales archaeon]
MKMQAIVLIWLLCLLAAGVASAQSSANYALNWSVVGSGGCEMASASYAMQSTVGQTVIGIASENYLLEAGYWYRDAGGVGGEPVTCGDLNGDGQITPADAAIALEIAAGSRPFDVAADVSGDGVVTSLDALMILQVAAGQIGIC